METVESIYRKIIEKDIEHALIIHFPNDIELTKEEREKAIDNAIKIIDKRTPYTDIAKEAIDIVLKKREDNKRRNCLNIMLRQFLGVETNQAFIIKDEEFAGDVYYFDGFGDVYYINDLDEDEYHPFLTLGRILSQYVEKVVPYNVEKVVPYKEENNEKNPQRRQDPD